MHNATCETNIKLRRFPKRNKVYLSAKGLKKILHIYGIPSMLREPVTHIGKPSDANHACMVVESNASGMPDENPRAKTTVNLKEILSFNFILQTSCHCERSEATQFYFKKAPIGIASPALRFGSQ